MGTRVAVPRRSCSADGAADLGLFELPGGGVRGQHSYLIQVKGEAQSRILVSMVPLLSRLLQERSLAVRERKLEEMIDFMAGQLVVPNAEDTRMAQRLVERQSRVLGEFGFFTAEQLAAFNQSRATNQGALANNWKKRGLAFSVPHRSEAAGSSA